MPLVLQGGVRTFAAKPGQVLLRMRKAPDPNVRRPASAEAGRPTSRADDDWRKPAGTIADRPSGPSPLNQRWEDTWPYLARIILRVWLMPSPSKR